MRMRAPDFRIVNAGDSALRVEFDAQVDPVINARVVALSKRLESSRLPGVLDVVPTIRSVAVYYDPARSESEELRKRIELEAADPAGSVDEPGVSHVIPVRYGGADGPDLTDLASGAGLSAHEAIALHTAPTYRVYMLGFLPG